MKGMEGEQKRGREAEDEGGIEKKGMTIKDEERERKETKAGQKEGKARQPLNSYSPLSFNLDSSNLLI